MVGADEQANLHLALATALMQSGGYRATGLATAVESAERVAAASDSLPLRCRVVLQMAAVLCGAGRNQVYVTAAERLIDDAAGHLSPGLHASLLVVRNVGYFHRGEFTVAEHAFQAARHVLSASPISESERLGGADIVVAAASYGSSTLQTLGRLDAAHDGVVAAEARARELNHPFSLAWALFSRSRVYGVLGNYEAAMADAEEALTISRQYGFSAFIARSTEYRGRARAGLGDVSGAIDDCRAALELWGKSGVVQSTPFIASNLAELLVAAGRSVDARKVLDDVDALVEGTDEAAALAECERVKGRIALADGDLSGAQHWLETAVATARRQGARLHELRATTRLAEVLAKRDRKADAYRFLAGVYESFPEGHRAPDLRTAEAVLDRLRD